MCSTYSLISYLLEIEPWASPTWSSGLALSFTQQKLQKIILKLWEKYQLVSPQNLSFVLSPASGSVAPLHDCPILNTSSLSNDLFYVK